MFCVASPSQTSCMLINYLKTAWRSIRKQKGFFALNLLGLYVSVISCFLIGLVLLHEASFDRQSPEGLTLYRIIGAENTSTGGEAYNAVTPILSRKPCAPPFRIKKPSARSNSTRITCW